MPRTANIRGVAEVFGYPPDAQSVEAQTVRSSYTCPFIGARCVKQSQHRDHDPAIPFGACSVWHKGEHDTDSKPYVICPVRFTQQGRVFSDVLKLFTNIPNASIEMVEELSLSEIGRIDQVLTQLNSADGSVIDFNVLEIMACSTTSTGYVISSFNSALRGEPAIGPLRYGINFRQVFSRLAIQALSKVEACEQWGVHMVWAIQDVLYDYITNTTMLDLQNIPLSALDNPSKHDLPALLLFIYKMVEGADHGQFQLVLEEIRGGTSEQFTQSMRPSRIPNRDRVTTRLQDKIRSGNSTPLTSQALAEIASELIESQPESEGQ